MLPTGPDVTGLSRQAARESRVRFWREKLPAASYVLEIALGTARIVRVRAGCDPRLLESVVRMLGALPC